MLARASRHTSTSAGTLRLGELISCFGGVSSGEKAAVTCDNNPGVAADRFGHARHKIDRKEAHTTEEDTRVHRKLKRRNYCEPPVRLYYYIYGCRRRLSTMVSGLLFPHKIIVTVFKVACRSL